jgi:small subunit ribosomal protein S18
MVRKRVKVCQFCRESVPEIDYKDIGKIRRFVSGRGKLLSSRLTGNCSKHQRMLTRAVKRARFVALLPFVQV